MKFPSIFICILYVFCFARCNNAQKIAHTNSINKYSYATASADGIGKFYMGREISFVMGFEGSDWLERDNRDLEENSSLALENMKVPANAVIADIGAGTGYFSFQLSKKVPQGKVFAVDIQSEMLNLINKKIIETNTQNITTIKSSEQSTNLGDSSIDLAIMVDVYHELNYPAEMLQSIHKSLKADGHILLIEYRGEDDSIPIKPLHKITVIQLSKELEANGFTLSFKGDFLPIQHFLMYKKKG